MVEVEDQHRDRVSPPVLVLSEGIGGLEQSAPVGESGQRVGQSIDPLLQFLTLFGHGEHDEGQGDAEQQRDKNDRREPDAGEHPLRFVDRHREVERQP